MNGSSESVKGATFVPDTTNMNVPESEPQHGASDVNNEGWLEFLYTGGGWLEAGQKAGGESGCCVLHPFIAHAVYVYEKKAYGYESYTWTGVNASPQNVYQIEDPANNGTWCEYIWGNQVACTNEGSYWPPYATHLAAGIEATDDFHPTNAGSQEVNYMARNGEFRAWGGSENHAQGYVSPGPYATHELCLTPNYASYHPGNANWGTAC
jgi:hypothetical protein